jgi:competence protein ComFC
MKLIRHFIDFLFPKSYIIRTLEAMESGAVVNLLSKNKNMLETPPGGIISLFPYRDATVHDLIHEIKYCSNRQLAEKIAPTLYNTCKELTFGFPATLVFTPISRNRKIKRGFDQGWIILGAIKAYDEKLNKNKTLFTYAREFLIWNRTTVQQSATASKAERLSNVHFAMTCTDQLLARNRTIIVLDDVCTTGATLFEAKRALEEVGASKVHLLTLAH